MFLSVTTKQSSLTDTLQTAYHTVRIQIIPTSISPHPCRCRQRRDIESFDATKCRAGHLRPLAEHRRTRKCLLPCPVLRYQSLVPHQWKWYVDRFVLCMAPFFLFICTEIQVDPLLGFAFLQTFIDVLREYFGTLSAATLKDNFDVVYQACSPFVLAFIYG